MMATLIIIWKALPRMILLPFFHSRKQPQAFIDPLLIGETFQNPVDTISPPFLASLVNITVQPPTQHISQPPGYQLPLLSSSLSPSPKQGARSSRKASPSPKPKDKKGRISKPATKLPQRKAFSLTPPSSPLTFHTNLEVTSETLPSSDHTEGLTDQQLADLRARGEDITQGHPITRNQCFANQVRIYRHPNPELEQVIALVTCSRANSRCSKDYKTLRDLGGVEKRNKKIHFIFDKEYIREYFAWLAKAAPRMREFSEG